MPAQPANLTPWARSGLALLCLLMAVSVGVRIYAYRQQSVSGTAVREAAGAPVDLGKGVLLPRSVAQHRSVQVSSCREPASVEFVQASPYGSDPSLLGVPRPNDHVFYVYRGWNLGSRFATASLNAIYFTRRAYARLAMQKLPATDDMAVKIIVPADCDASPDDVLAALRREARSSD
ncbi:hypothetical protein [Methylobacterium sp. J-077]|uniref:hypothetical protein n=1 Tax=Methylobacterium sp. J-077 TaxID=2836656 RepID=UPI001FB9E013|nr:hypothetical protein [Methylobacterium sp. J-077]MCJ2123138.1 hypothetical protein [Methylobacterium sp. J-077]